MKLNKIYLLPICLFSLTIVGDGTLDITKAGEDPKLKFLIQRIKFKE